MPGSSVMNNAKTLFIFEGAKKEGKLVEKLEQNFLGSRHTIKCVFDAEIYQLYRAIKDEGDFPIDIVALLKERTDENARILKDYNRDSFAFVYLFFDYDAHSSLADDDKIKEMLLFFNDETEKGMLYISYPMVEAIRHYRDKDSFRNLNVKCKRSNCPYISECADRDACMKEPHYKRLVANECRPQLSNVNSYTEDIWKELIDAHLCKANYLVNDIFALPDSLITQTNVFSKQLEKHICHKCPEVTVLSAFPLFILDYFGCARTIERLRLSENEISAASGKDNAGAENS